MQVTPEILRELNNSRNRGEKADDPMSIYILSSSPYSLDVIYSICILLPPLHFCNNAILDSLAPTPLSVVNKTIQEDRFDIPDVPMEED